MVSSRNNVYPGIVGQPGYQGKLGIPGTLDNKCTWAAQMTKVLTCWQWNSLVYPSKGSSTVIVTSLLSSHWHCQIFNLIFFQIQHPVRFQIRLPIWNTMWPLKIRNLLLFRFFLAHLCSDFQTSFIDGLPKACGFKLCRYQSNAEPMWFHQPIPPKLTCWYLSGV